MTTRTAVRAFVLVCATLLAAPTLAEHLSGGTRIEFTTAAGTEKIPGFAFLPAGASPQSKVPGMVIVHGSSGIRNAREGFWGRALSAAGIAALALDSFTPRNIGATAEDQSKLSTAQQVRDAYGALAYLAALPEVDADRIAIMGMSRGGMITLLAADERTAVHGGARFAGHIPLYPGCSLQYRNPRVRAPILALIGANDDYTGVKECAAYGERIRAAGGTFELKTYAGAHHGFDTTGLHVVRVNRVQNLMDCVIYIEDDGRGILSNSGEAVPMNDPPTSEPVW